MFFKLKFPIIFFSILLGVFLFSNSPARAVCSEPGASGYLVCEDWDTLDMPPTTSTCSSSCPDTQGSYCCPCSRETIWPWKSGPTWHGWWPVDYGRGTCGELSTSIKHSGTRSLHRIKPLGVEDGQDLEITWANSTNVYIRFYLYYDAATAASLTTADPGTHFMYTIEGDRYIFLDFDNNGEIQNGNYYDQGIPATLGLDTYNPDTAIANNTAPRGERNYFVVHDHGEEWLCIELNFNCTNDTVSMWINGVQQVNNYSFQLPNTVGSWRIAAFSNDTSHRHDFWIDDFVVSTSYIGPRNDSQPPPDTIPPAAPSGLTIS